MGFNIILFYDKFTKNFTSFFLIHNLSSASEYIQRGKEKNINQ